jgi:nicotinamide-nucleotide amidase
MKIQLIIIGNELLNGKIQDKNTKFLAKLAHKFHLELTKVYLIKDDEKAFSDALAKAWEESDLILTSGGLGPTKDDITKDMLAKFFHRKLVEDKTALETVSKQYQEKQREYSPSLNYQFIPEDFSVIYNKIGFAPGLKFIEDGKMIASLPGVPHEYQVMLEEEVFPQYLQYHKPKYFQKHVIVRTYKIPEAKIFYKVAPKLWEELKMFGEVSSLPHAYGVDIGVKIKADEAEEIQSIENEIIHVIKNTELKEYIWHIGEESLEEVIIQEAKAKNLTFGFAESCTGGLCASRITDVSGSSAVFWGSVVSYANEVKMNSLNVKADTLENHGAVSRETALEMATGARAHLKVDIAVTTTGIAGPDGGTKEKPVGTVGIGFSDAKASDAMIYHLSGNREQLKLRFSQVALFTLLERIREA